ncbi:6942_t:CDS:2, partial [Cetraspora pellucida]
MPNMSAKILSNDGHELGPNNPDELCIRGPTVMKGYLKNKDATDVIFDKYDFLHTGDIIYVDNQAELEEILLTHPKILDVAVIGYYSEQCQTEFLMTYIIFDLLFIDEVPKSESGKILRRVLREALMCELIDNQDT